MDDFGQLVKHRRNQKGLSSRELSRLIGKSSAYVSELERGIVKRPSYDVAKRLADVLGIDESVLDYFGYVPPEIEEQMERDALAQIEQREEIEKAYIANITQELNQMDLESLEALSYAMNDGANIVWMLYTLQRMGQRQALSTIEEFVQFVHSKHAE